MFVLKTDRACTDTSLPILKRDALLESDNGGVQWLADFASRYSYPTQAAPTNGVVVNNMDESVNDGTFVLQSGDAPTYAGGGVDFTGVSKMGNYLNGPSSALASIWSAANQYFIACIYMKLPTLANWNAGGALEEIFKCCPAGPSTYSTVPEMVMFAQQTASSAISIRRQKAAATADTLTIAPAAGDYGSFVQIAFWRDATGQYARLKSANGTVSATLAVSTNNTQNFSALTPKLGVVGGFGGTPLGGVMGAPEQNMAKYRIYRTFIENLVTSGRDATTVLDADYTRTVGRGVFS